MLLGLVLPPSASSAAASSRPFLDHSVHGLRLPPRPLRLLPLVRPRPSAVTVRAMAKREEEMKAIRDMSTDAINEEVIDLQGELLMLRLQRAARKEFKPSEFGRMRKRIARMLTVKREREIEQGINKRQSRKLDKEWKRNTKIGPPLSLRKMREEKKAAEAQKSS